MDLLLALPLQSTEQRSVIHLLFWKTWFLFSLQPCLSLPQACLPSGCVWYDKPVLVLNQFYVPVPTLSFVTFPDTIVQYLPVHSDRSACLSFCCFNRLLSVCPSAMCVLAGKIKSKLLSGVYGRIRGVYLHRPSSCQCGSHGMVHASPVCPCATGKADTNTTLRRCWRTASRVTSNKNN